MLSSQIVINTHTKVFVYIDNHNESTVNRCTHCSTGVHIFQGCIRDKVQYTSLTYPLTQKGDNYNKIDQECEPIGSTEEDVHQLRIDENSTDTTTRASIRSCNTMIIKTHTDNRVGIMYNRNTNIGPLINLSSSAKSSDDVSYNKVLLGSHSHQNKISRGIISSQNYPHEVQLVAP